MARSHARSQILGIVAGILAVRALTALAGEYDVTKTVTWDVTTQQAKVPSPAQPNVETQGPNSGQWRYAQHVFAGDKHNESLHDHKDQTLVGDPRNPLVIAPTAPFQLADAPDGDSDGSPPLYTNHLHWSDFTAFDQGANLNLANHIPKAYLPLQLTASSTHPGSDSLVELSTTRKPPGGAFPAQTFTTDAIIHLKGQAYAGAKAPPNAAHAPEKIFADSFAAGEIVLAGTAKAGTIVNNKIGKAVAVDMKGTVSSFRAGTSSNEKTRKGVYSDPVRLEVTDAVSGDIIAENTLFHQQWLAIDDASVAWDDMIGLVLTTGVEGAASVEIGTPSPWVLNPFNGGAMLVDGSLSTSGAFAGLGWVVDTAGGITTATLPLSDLTSHFLLELEIDGLGDPPNDVNLRLYAPAQGYASEGAEVVPEPATLTLLLFGAGLLAGVAAVSHRQCRAFRFS